MNMMFLRISLILFLLPMWSWSAPTPFVPGSRVQALSGAFTGLADDANAIFYNPAGIAYLYQLSTDISFWRTDDGKFGGVSAMFVNPSTSANTTVGIGWTGTGLTSATSEERGGAFIVPTVYSPSKGFPIGMGLKLVYARNSGGDLKWRGTVDAGTMLMFAQTIRVGAVMRNIIKTNLSRFPSSLAAGGSWTPVPAFTVVLDIEGTSTQQIRDGDATYAAGIEVNPIMYAVFRGGTKITPNATLYSFGAETKQTSGGSGLGLAYWFPSEDFEHGWFSVGFTYMIR